MLNWAVYKNTRALICAMLTNGFQQKVQDWNDTVL